MQRLRSASDEERAAQQHEEQARQAELQLQQEMDRELVRLRRQISQLRQLANTLRQQSSAALLHELSDRCARRGYNNGHGRAILAAVAEMLGERRFDGW